MSRIPLHSTALSADMFKRSAMSKETVISSAEYMALLKAARDKNKIPEFLNWQRDRKIILKG